MTSKIIAAQRKNNLTKNRIIHEGYEAFMNKESTFSCPYQGEKLTLWLRGYNQGTLAFY